MTVMIVPFQKEEQKEAYQFCISIYNELNWDKRYMDGLDNLAKYFGKFREIFFLAKEDDKIIGCGGIKELSSEEGLLKRFYVDKDYRGQGIAKQILIESSHLQRKRSISFSYSTRETIIIRRSISMRRMDLSDMFQSQ